MITMIGSQQATAQTIELSESHSARLQALTQREASLQLRMSDLRVQLQQLREQKDALGPSEGVKFNPQLAALEHQYAATGLEFNAVAKQIQALSSPERIVAPGTTTQASAPLFDRGMVEELMGGTLLLMLPLVIVIARRAWVRTSAEQRAVTAADNPRLQRLEEGMEAIAIEIERIGEAQRFATKLLVERMPETPAARATPVPAVVPAVVPGAVPRRVPGSITPH